MEVKATEGFWCLQGLDQQPPLKGQRALAPWETCAWEGHTSEGLSGCGVLGSCFRSRARTEAVDRKWTWHERLGTEWDGQATPTGPETGWEQARKDGLAGWKGVHSGAWL